MSKALNTLLTALAATPGETVEEKMEKLIKDGAIFTPNLDSMLGMARALDHTFTIVNGGWLEQSELDITATNLSERLRNIHINVSAQGIRANPEFWSESHVAAQEENYRRGQEMYIPRPKRHHRNALGTGGRSRN